MGAPAVSIIVPVYNGERYLRGCIDSILAQTFGDFEAIFINDGSADQSAEILAQYAEADARIRVIEQPNSGVSAARNRGLDIACGEFIRFVDCDDTLPAESLEQLVCKARETGSDLVIAAYNEILMGISTRQKLVKREATLSFEDFLPHFTKYPTSFYYGVLWNKIFRREHIELLHLRFDPHMTWGEDFTFVAQYLVACQRVTHMTGFVYNYLRNPNGLTLALFYSVFKKPFRSLSFRLKMYHTYCELFHKRGFYEKYRHKLWRFMITFPLNK